MQTTKLVGDLAEDKALAFLLEAGLRLHKRNYRTPGRGGGEIDLIMSDANGTLIFVEVRRRSHSEFEGAGNSIGYRKQQKIIFAARHYLTKISKTPPCRFDAVLVEDTIQWIRAAFDAS